MTVDLSKIALLPLKGHPLPEGATLAADCVHAQVVKAAPWAPAKPVLDLHGGDADLVLLAVPAGLGQVLAQWIAQQIIAIGGAVVTELERLRGQWVCCPRGPSMTLSFRDWLIRRYAKGGWRCKACGRTEATASSTIGPQGGIDAG